jgi:ABC-type ATPase involved in cell division
MTADVMQILDELHRKGTTVLFATHNTDLVERYPHRAIPISGERKQEEEPENEVKTPG